MRITMAHISVIAGEISRPGACLRRLALGFGFCLSAWAFSFQQTPGSREMEATVRTYWPRGQFTLRAETNLVEVAAVVRDSRGRAVGGLTRDDFEIDDAGMKREITAFSVETFAPAASPTVRAGAASKATAEPSVNPTGRQRYLALLFDDFSMAQPQQVQVKAAAKHLIKEGLAKGDRVGLFTTSGKQIIPFTEDVRKLAAAVDRYNSFPAVINGGICPKLTPYDAYVIANKIDFESYLVKYNERNRCTQAGRRDNRPGSARKSEEPPRSFAEVPMNDELMMQAGTMFAQVRDISGRALDTIDKLVGYMGRLPGKRMILLASSGLLVRTLEAEHQKVIDNALRADVVINALDAKGLYADDPPESTLGADMRSLQRMAFLEGKEKDLGNDLMAILSSGTGGLFFDNNNDLNLGFRELGMIPEVSYLLGFSPEEKPNNKYHALKVRLRSRNDFLVQARPGYWSLPKEAGQPAPERRIDREMLGTEPWTELPAVISSQPAKTDNGDPALEAIIRIDPRKFHFVEKGGVRNQTLVFIGALFDDGGNFVAGTELEVKFGLKKATFERLSDTGLEMSVMLEAPPGAYQFRGVAQDGVDGKIVAASLSVEVERNEAGVRPPANETTSGLGPTGAGMGSYAGIKTVVDLSREQLLSAYKAELKDLAFDEIPEPLSAILKKTGDRVRSFFEDFPKILCTEQVRLERLNGQGRVEASIARTYFYSFSHESGSSYWEETRTERNGRPVDLNAIAGFFLASGRTGLTAFLHPNHQAGSRFRYLGRQAGDTEAYVIAFEQKPEAGDYLGSYQSAAFPAGSPLLFQGLVWVDPANYQIIRMRIDLLAPRVDIGLSVQRSEIWFAEVRFASTLKTYWLPREVLVTNKSIYSTSRNRHRYSDYRIFSVSVEDKITVPSVKKIGVSGENKKSPFTIHKWNFIGDW